MFEKSLCGQYYTNSGKIIAKMKNLTYRQLSSACRSVFLPMLEAHGFKEIDQRCLFTRRANEVVHVVSVNKSSHGPRVRIQLHFWVPEFSAGTGQELSLSEALMLSWAKMERLGVYSIGPEKWWPVGSREEAEESFTEAVSPFVRGGVPWFAKVITRLDLIPLLLPDAPSELGIALLSESTLSMPNAIQKQMIWNGIDPDPSSYLARPVR